MSAKGKVVEMVCTIDCTAPASDKVFDVAAFQTFLTQRIKVQGKAGNLGKAVVVKREGDKIIVRSTAGFSKQYLKYLTKKFLKKNSIRDWIRVIAVNPKVYELRYFNVGDAEEEEEEEQN